MPSREVQLHYVSEIVKLMLRHMHHLMSEQGVPYKVALADYADIYRKTCFYNLDDVSETQHLRPHWDRLSAQLEAMYDRYLSDKNPATEMEEPALELLWPHLVERIDRELPIVDYKQDTTFGCFFYAPAERVIDLHFVNKVRPASPFEKPLDRAAELYELLRYCAEYHPDLKKIKFGSWLNDYPPYRKLFPAGWTDSGEKKSYNSLAWWGQFMNHRGDIHVHNARHFRETGDFPYRCTFHQCAVEELEEHLLNLLKDGEENAQAG